MFLTIARVIMGVLGAIYAILGIYMVGNGIVNEIVIRTVLPMLVLVDSPPQSFFEGDQDDPFEKDYIPFIVAGIMLAIVGVSFLLNIRNIPI